MFFDDMELDDLVEIVRQAVHRSDPCGLLARGEDPAVYDAAIKRIAQRVFDGELLVPSLVAEAFRERIHQIDPEDIREIARQIGLGLGFG